MKKLLFFVVLCFVALSLSAQKRRGLPEAQSRPVILQPPRIIIYLQGVVPMSWGRIHYGGDYGQSVVLLQPPKVYIQPVRVLYVLPNVADTLFEARLRFKIDFVKNVPRLTGRLPLNFDSSVISPQIYVLPPNSGHEGWLRYKKNALMYP